MRAAAGELGGRGTSCTAKYRGSDARATAAESRNSERKPHVVATHSPRDGPTACEISVVAPNQAMARPSEPAGARSTMVALVATNASEKATPWPKRRP